MPPACVNAATTRNHACTTRQQKTTNRAASVPANQRENSRRESLRPKKPKLSLLDTENSLSPSLPSVVAARTRKRNSSFCATFKADCMASTSTSVAEQTVDNSEQRPRKRHKRSSSTPPAPRPSQLSSQLQLRRRRSRLGSPATDVECLPPSRVSARLARRAQSFMINRNSDIYTHLAGPDGVGSLLNEAPGGSIISSTLNDAVGSQSTKWSRGRQKKAPDFTDQKVKRDLIEEWTRMRQSQGTLSLSSINQDARFSQMPLNQNGEGSIPSSRPETITQRSSSNADLVSPRMNGIGASRSQGTELDVSPLDFSLTQVDSKNASSMSGDVSENKLDRGSVTPSDGRAEPPIPPSSGIEVPPTPVLDSRIDKDSSASKPADDPKTVQHLELSQYPELFLASLSGSPLGVDSIYTRHPRSSKSPANEQAEPDLPTHSHPATFSSTYPLNTGDIYPDSDEEFYMLDIPEIFTLPWVSVSSHLYVPPSLGKLISGMREQLVMEARARRKAEELYQAELRRRISAEKTVEDLRTRLKLEA